MKVAVIGSGAAATGVLAGLEKWARPGTEVTVIDVGRELSSPPVKQGDDGFTDDELRDVYGQLWSTHGFTFPPPKSHFGETLSKLKVEERPFLWKSEHRGGLTNVWGGGMFPFTDHELARWPVTAADMRPYYGLIADKVGVCGEADALGDYFGDDFVNRPPLHTSPVIEALRDTVNGHGDGHGHGWKLVAGASRLALETRQGLERSCIYTGECMLGCPRSSIWSASRALDDYQQAGVVTRYVRGRARRFQGRHVHFLPEGGAHEQSLGPFDRIYLAAGCIGSTEIVMRSLGIERGPVMQDNAVLSFPLLHAGLAGGLKGDDGRYFSLCNLSMLGIADDPDEATAQVSVYPSFDHLWRYYTPPPLWKAMAPLWHVGRWRLLLGRVFFGGGANRGFEFQLEENGVSLHRQPAPDITGRVASFMKSLRAATNHDGFFVPPVRPGSHASSSHYGASFPYGGTLVPVSASGEIAPGVHLADASTFVDAPALSPTFTIMANACRTARESLA